MHGGRLGERAWTWPPGGNTMSTTNERPAGISGGARDGQEQAGGLSLPVNYTTSAPVIQGPDPLAFALDYARRGWHVLPVTPGGKVPLIKGWEKDATTDPATITAWWQAWPEANIGIACGLSRLAVIDLDVHNPEANGPEAWRDLKLAFGFEDATVISLTPSGGQHHVFAIPPGLVITNSRGQLPAGIDIRADGGQFVAPPSVVNGRLYQWEFGPDDATPAPLPEALIKLLRAPTPQASATGDTIPEGARNSTLASIAGTMRRRNMTPAAILAALLAENAARCDPPLPESEVQAIAASVGKYPAAPAPLPQDGTLPAGLAGLADLPTTDAGQGEAIAALYAERLRYDHTRARWLCWDQVRWQPDQDGEPARLALTTARQRLAAAARVEDEEKRKRLAKWAIGAESDYRIRCALHMAGITRPLATTADQFDRDPWLLACANGVLDLRTGELRPGQQNDMLTLSTGIAYNPDAPCPRWAQFLQEIFQGDNALIGFIQRAAGHSLTGLTTEQVLFLCHGGGANGKSVFLATLRRVLGEYAINTSFDTFVDDPRGGKGASNDLAALRAARLVTASEVKEGARLNEGRVKSLTGGDAITARFLFAEFFTFTPAFKLWLAVNHRPTVRGTDEAIWRRIRLIPFLATFGPDQADRNLTAKLADEAPGILAWAVRGCLAWQREGLGAPPAVNEATAAYRQDSDLLATFLTECTLPREGATVRAADLYASYKSWCEANGEKALTGTALGRRLGERGIAKVHKREGWQYIGLGLLTNEATK